MSQGRQLVFFFVAVFAWTWGIVAIMILAPDWTAATFGDSDTAFNPLFFLAVYGPSLSGIVLTGIFEGKRGLRELFARLHPMRARVRWYFVVVVGMILLSLLSGLGGGALGLTDMPTVGSVGSILAALGVALLAVPGPLGEELGWRGFALPRLLGRWSPLTSSLVLGVIWAVWHLPAFVLSDSPQQAFNLPLFLLGAVALSVIVTWLFVRTNGSVLITILFHLMANNANDVTGVGFEAFAIGTMVCALVLIFFGNMRKPAPSLARTPSSTHVEGATA